MLFVATPSARYATTIAHTVRRQDCVRGLMRISVDKRIPVYRYPVHCIERGACHLTCQQPRGFCCSIKTTRGSFIGQLTEDCCTALQMLRATRFGCCDIRSRFDLMREAFAVRTLSA